MRKNNKEVAARGHKRHMKNVARKKRSEELKKFNDLAYRIKAMQAMVEAQNKASEEQK
jgi:hypothetical protein